MLKSFACGLIMLNKTVKILFALVLIGISLYVVTQNSSPLTVFLTPGWTLSASAGVVLIVVFIFGVVSASLVAAYFAVKAGWRETRLLRRDRDRQAFMDAILEARSLLAAGEWQKSAAAWERIVKRDPENAVAQSELSRCWEGAGDLKEALRVVDAARLKAPGNVEVLFRAAELNLALGNRTAAVDNLALILYHLPSRKAARLARDLSEELGRLQDACEYQDRLEAFGEPQEALRPARARLEFRKLLEELPATEDLGKTRLASALKGLLKRFPDYPPALERLAALEAEAGRIEEAAQLQIKAAKVGGESFWRQASKLWIENNMADRAVAAARAAVRSAANVARVNAELYLIGLLLQLGKLDEAKPLIDGFTAMAREEKVELCPGLELQLGILKAWQLCRSGDATKSAEVLEQLAQRG